MSTLQEELVGACNWCKENDPKHLSYGHSWVKSKRWRRWNDFTNRRILYPTPTAHLDIIHRKLIRNGKIDLWNHKKYKPCCRQRISISTQRTKLGTSPFAVAISWHVQSHTAFHPAYDASSSHPSLDYIPPFAFCDQIPKLGVNSWWILPMLPCSAL